MKKIITTVAMLSTIVMAQNLNHNVMNVDQIKGDNLSPVVKIDPYPYGYNKKNYKIEKVEIVKPKEVVFIDQDLLDKQLKEREAKAKIVAEKKRQAAIDKKIRIAQEKEFRKMKRAEDRRKAQREKEISIRLDKFLAEAEFIERQKTESDDLEIEYRVDQDKEPIYENELKDL